MLLHSIKYTWLRWLAENRLASSTPTTSGFRLEPVCKSRWGAEEVLKRGTSTASQPALSFATPPRTRPSDQKDYQFLRHHSKARTKHQECGLRCCGSERSDLICGVKNHLSAQNTAKKHKSSLTTKASETARAPSARQATRNAIVFRLLGCFTDELQASCRLVEDGRRFVEGKIYLCRGARSSPALSAHPCRSFAGHHLRGPVDTIFEH